MRPSRFPSILPPQTRARAVLMKKHDLGDRLGARACGMRSERAKWGRPPRPTPTFIANISQTPACLPVCLSGVCRSGQTDRCPALVTQHFLARRGVVTQPRNLLNDNSLWLWAKLETLSHYLGLNYVLYYRGAAAARTL